jgi:hypothetical protein
MVEEDTCLEIVITKKEETGERKNVKMICVQKHGAKRQLGRPRHRWEYNIKRNANRISKGGMGLCVLNKNKLQLL